MMEEKGYEFYAEMMQPRWGFEAERKARRLRPVQRLIRNVLSALSESREG